jgi:hypothetical protein
MRIASLALRSRRYVAATMVGGLAALSAVVAASFGSGTADAYSLPGPRSQFPGTMLVESSSGKCIDAGVGTDGTHLTLRTCRPKSASQWWTRPQDGTVRSVLTGLCMDVVNATTDPDTRIQTAYCSGNLGQQWLWSPGWHFESGLTDKCLDIAAEFGENPADGTEINTWWCDPNVDPPNRKQIWQVRYWDDPS